MTCLIEYRPISQDILASYSDCPPYLASIENVDDLLHPTETNVRENWLHAETVRVTMLPAQALQEADSSRQSAGSHLS